LWVARVDAICQYDWVTAHLPAPGLFLGVTADLDHPVTPQGMHESKISYFSPS
jgi:hypothetical protein